MYKYGTYKVFKNKTTGEILRVAMDDSLEKTAEDTAQWVQLDADPEVTKTED